MQMSRFHLANIERRPRACCILSGGRFFSARSGLLVGQFPSAVLRAGDDLQDSSASLTAIVSICVCCAHNVSINLFASFKVISHVATFSRKISSENEPMRPRAISRVSRSRLSFSSGAYLAVNLPTTNERDTATAKKPGNRRSS